MRSAKVRRLMVRVVVALGLAATLSGCVVAPLGPPGYYRPRPYRYYYY